ncbi:hypothetical protein FRC00_003477 [Tulasnella sp. 408]|nr:hypothetical protein FRC00_003477 [Tulasnella sp. 408]
MIGFAFRTEKEAAAFLEELHDLDKYASEASQSKEMNRPPTETGKKRSKKDDTALKSTISAPSHFEHVGHMSWSEHTGFSSRGVDDAWISVAGSLEKFRVTEKPIKGRKQDVQHTVDKVRAEGSGANKEAYETPDPGEGSSKPVVPLQTPLLAPSAPDDVDEEENPPATFVPPSPPPALMHDDEFDGVKWIMEPIVTPLESQPTPIAAAQFTHVEHVRQSEKAGLSSSGANEKWTALIEALELPEEELSEEPGSVPGIEVQLTPMATSKLKLSSEDKVKVKSAIPQDSGKILCASLRKAGKTNNIGKNVLGNFKLSHITWSEETGFGSRGADESSWVERLQLLGISEENVKGNEKYIQEFLETPQAEGVSAPNRRRGVAGTGEGTSKSIVPVRPPPPAAPTAIKSNRKPPSPPARGNGPAASVDSPRPPRLPPPPPPTRVSQPNVPTVSMNLLRPPGLPLPLPPTGISQPNVPAASMDSPGAPPPPPPRRAPQPPPFATTQVKQVAPMGQTEGTNSSSRDLDESLAPLLGQLERSGISEKVVRGNEEFVRRFVEKANADGLDAANKTFGVSDKR